MHHTGKGNPFNYYSFGVSLIEVTVDCLRGTYTLDSAKVVHDLGRTIVPGIDLGQVVGGLAQGMGWVALEDFAYDNEGKLVSQAHSTYKIPDNNFLPDQIEVKFLEHTRKRSGPMGSKAVGESPLMYGIGAFFAIQQAIHAFNKQQCGKDGCIPEVTVSPMRAERALLSLYPKSSVGTLY